MSVKVPFASRPSMRTIACSLRIAVPPATHSPSIMHGLLQRKGSGGDIGAS